MKNILPTFLLIIISISLVSSLEISSSVPSSVSVVSQGEVIIPGGGNPSSPPKLEKLGFLNKTFLCKVSGEFVTNHTINGTLSYTKTDYSKFKDYLGFNFGVEVSDEILEAFINNYPGNCIEEKKHKFDITILIIALIIVILASVIFILFVIVQRYSLFMSKK